jgi:DUF4097 and DUF4098 domain-containing protein YvlB
MQNHMKSFNRVVVWSLAAVLLLTVSALAGRKETEIRTYEAKELVEVNTVSGNLVVKVGESDKIIVELEYSVRPRDNYEPRFRERDNAIELSERFHGSSNGSSYWTVTVPKETRIEFSTASGDLVVDGLSGDIDAEIASGNIDIYNCSGDFDLRTASGSIDFDSCGGAFDLSTASGRIRISRCSGVFDLSVASGGIRALDCRGEFDLSTASGSVRASDVVIEGRSSFSSASGSAYVTLAESTEFDLSVSSASGKAILDFGGNPVKGYFEFLAREDRGRIEAPYDFDGEDYFRRHGNEYVRKTFAVGGDTPEIRIETASGTAALRK